MLRQALLENGYEPILVCGKRAVSHSWQAVSITREWLADEEAAHPQATNTGIRTGRVIAFDNDIRDEAHALAVEEVAIAKLGYTDMRRYGSKPRPLLLHRCATPQRKITIRGRAPGADKATTLCEFLGDGQQIVVNGTHPDTLRPYSWENADIGAEPAQRPLARVAETTPERVAEAVHAICEKLKALGYLDVLSSLREPPGQRQEGPPTRRPFTPKMLTEMVRVVEPDEPRDQWFAIGAALKDADCTDPDFDKRDLFSRWSRGEIRKPGDNRGAPANWKDDDDSENLYDSVKPKADGIHAGTLVKMAQERGYVGPIDGTPPDQVFAHCLAMEPSANSSEGQWSFGLCDPVADERLPPITYRDELKLWPDSPDGTVTQITGVAKGHKTNFILSEMFRLMHAGKARPLYLPLEGTYGIRRMRIPALASHFGVPLADLRNRFQVAKIERGGTFDLSNMECVRAFAAWVKQDGWTDVIIDTQHRAAGGLEENSATDARVLWNAVEYIRREARCNVTLLHHLGKDASKGGRGSSADLASVDQQIELSFDRTTMIVTAKVSARKDGVDGFAVRFKVHQRTENSVPILVPMSDEEFAKTTTTNDRVTPAAIASALRERKVVGRTNAITTRELATEMLRMRDELPRDQEAQDREVDNLQNRLNERAAKDIRIGVYGPKDGAHRTAQRRWYIPSEPTEPCET